MPNFDALELSTCIAWCRPYRRHRARGAPSRHARALSATAGVSMDTLVLVHEGDSVHTKCTKERAAPLVRVSFGQPCGVMLW